MIIHSGGTWPWRPLLSHRAVQWRKRIPNPRNWHNLGQLFQYVPFLSVFSLFPTVERPGSLGRSIWAYFSRFFPNAYRRVLVCTCQRFPGDDLHFSWQCCVAWFFVSRIGSAASSSDTLQKSWQTWCMVRVPFLVHSVFLHILQSTNHIPDSALITSPRDM